MPHARALQRLLALGYLLVWFSAFHGRRDFGLVWRTGLVFAVYQFALIICAMILLVGGRLLGWIEWSPFAAAGSG